MAKPRVAVATTALAADSHQIELQPLDVDTHEVLHTDIVFAGGEHAGSLLKRIRVAWPALPFIIWPIRSAVIQI